jgi:hypothetical protein
MPQLFFKFGFFRSYPARQNRCDFQVKSPELIDGHRIKIVFHRFNLAVILNYLDRPPIRTGRKTGRIPTRQWSPDCPPVVKTAAPNAGIAVEATRGSLNAPLS